MNENLKMKIEDLKNHENRNLILKEIISDIEEVECQKYFSTDSKEITNINNQILDIRKDLKSSIRGIDVNHDENNTESSSTDEKKSIKDNFIRNINKVDLNRRLFEEGENKITSSYLLMNQVNVGISNISDQINRRRKAIMHYKRKLMIAVGVFSLLCFILFLYKLNILF